MSRRRDRSARRLRPVRFVSGYTEMTPGSVLIEMGRTVVLATASFSDSVPRWMRKSGSGWVNAEYNMLPGSSERRIRRDQYTGGRSKEISRMIGRSLRSVVHLKQMGEMMVNVDCDVIQADGGTRTAAVTGGWVALALAVDWLQRGGALASSPLTTQAAATSVGLSGGEALLDLDYDEDSSVEADFNVVQLGTGRFVEAQGTAERAPFSRGDVDRVLALAESGIRRLFELQRETLAAWRAARG